MSDPAQADLRSWYNLVKKDAPAAAVGLAGLAVGLLIVVLSGSMTDSVKSTMLLFGQIMMGIGCGGFALGLIIFAVKSLRT